MRTTRNYFSVNGYLFQGYGKYFWLSFAAEGVQLVYDFGAILDKVVKPVVGEGAKTIQDAILMFEHYYENNEQIDYSTHGIGPGIIALVLHLFMEFLGLLVNQKLDHSITGPTTMTPLSVYVEKLRDIVSTVVTDDMGNFGRLKKVKESEMDQVNKQRNKNYKTTE